MGEYSKELFTMKRVIRTALNELSPDLVLKNCNLVNVYTEEIAKTDVSITAGRIASIYRSKSVPKKILNCDGYYAVPGLIDGHVHLDVTLLTPSELAKIILP